ncbi:hypothetical protein [Sandarakinorhabdus sp.]|uniref:hypothetical protein n=1 Tax=Sandarakinorhabdus sp. TaxID=1916663 RepID=UPI00286DCC43|nr:hypothetical protein [Sandarakinorhabdus sp.]
MTDLRQGVTPAAHDVLDVLDTLRSPWAREPAANRRAEAVLSLAHTADTAPRRSDLVRAAAFLLLAIEQIDADADHAV